jgi:hypothetical protein
LTYRGRDRARQGLDRAEVGNSVVERGARLRHDGPVDKTSADVQEAVAAVTARRGWPWQQPGRLSVGLDEQDQIVEYVADDDGEPVPVRVLGRVTHTDG